ncbi:MAG: type II toxin-antitoxin system VapC family toxin [Bacteroidota bacterium]
MIRFLLDTNVISDVARPEPQPSVLSRYERHFHESALAATSWHELLYGVERLPAGRRKTELSRYMLNVIAPSLPVFSYDSAAAEWHAQERARLDAAGRTRSYTDGLIAAVAASRDLILVTRNVRDFEGYAGLHVENWFEP